MKGGVVAAEQPSNDIELACANEGTPGNDFVFFVDVEPGEQLEIGIVTESRITKGFAYQLSLAEPSK